MRCRKMLCMRLVIISIGRLKQGPERELSERYRERFDDIWRHSQQLKDVRAISLRDLPTCSVCSLQSEDRSPKRSAGGSIRPHRPCS